MKVTKRLLSKPKIWVRENGIWDSFCVLEGDKIQYGDVSITCFQEDTLMTLDWVAEEVGVTKGAIKIRGSCEVK